MSAAEWNHFDSASREIDGKAVRIVIEGASVFEDRVDQSIERVDERESIRRAVKVRTHLDTHRCKEPRHGSRTGAAASSDHDRVHKG
jgi:hypothetical protein